MVLSCRALELVSAYMQAVIKLCSKCRGNCKMSQDCIGRGTSAHADTPADQCCFRDFHQYSGSCTLCTHSVRVVECSYDQSRRRYTKRHINTARHSKAGEIVHPCDVYLLCIACIRADLVHTVKLYYIM
jgi:hypothetical protein